MTADIIREQQILDHSTKRGISTIKRLTGYSLETPQHRTLDRAVPLHTRPHVMTIHSGRRYWLWCTQLRMQAHGRGGGTGERSTAAVLVDRTIRPGYPHPKMVLMPLGFEDHVYANTLFEVDHAVVNGEEARDDGSNGGGAGATSVLLINDLVVFANEFVHAKWDVLRRFRFTSNLLRRMYVCTVGQPCMVQLKRLFGAARGMHELRAFAATMAYVVRGVAYLIAT